MACTNCGKKRVNRTRAILERSGTKLNMKDHPDFYLIEYYPGGSHSRVVPSPTGVMPEEFGVANYGLKSPRRQFHVHKDDIASKPSVFRLVNPEDNPNGVASVTTGINETSTAPVMNTGMAIPPLVPEVEPVINDGDTDEPEKASIPKAKPIIAKHMLTGTETEYSSMGKAAKAFKLTSAKLKNAIENGLDLDGYKFFFASIET